MFSVKGELKRMENSSKAFSKEVALKRHFSLYVFTPQTITNCNHVMHTHQHLQAFKLDKYKMI